MHALPLKLACAALVAMALGACSSPPTNARGQVVPQALYQPAESSNPYVQTSWELARWARVDGSLRTVPHSSDNQQPITLTFMQENGRRQLAGFAGCNNYTGDYTVANGLIILTAPPQSTRRACPHEDGQPVDGAPSKPKPVKGKASAAGKAKPAAAPLGGPLERYGLERDYLSGLPGITASALDQYSNPTRLTLTFANGDVLDFARRLDPIAGQVGATKLIYVNAQRVPCMGVAPMSCLQVRDDPAQPWQLFYGNIVGFDFQPGSIYRLRVVESIDPNPPADAPSTRWVLDAIIERTAAR